MHWPLVAPWQRSPRWPPSESVTQQLPTTPAQNLHTILEVEERPCAPHCLLLVGAEELVVGAEAVGAALDREVLAAPQVQLQTLVPEVEAGARHALPQ